MENLISHQIKKLRLQRGWTQAQLAYNLGVSPQTISNWETGLKLPRKGAIQKMAILFNVTEYEIISGYPSTSTVKTADLDDDGVIFTYKGTPISKEDRELIRRLMNGKE